MFVCVECLIGKQKKPTLLKVTETSPVPYRTRRTPPACAKRAAYPDPPPVMNPALDYRVRANGHGMSKDDEWTNLPQELDDYTGGHVI